jgi:hypothetical protein
LTTANMHRSKAVPVRLQLTHLKTQTSIARRDVHPVSRRVLLLPTPS